MTRGMVRLIVAAQLAIALAAFLWPIERGSGEWAVVANSPAAESAETADGGESITPLQLLIEGSPNPLLVDGVELEHPAANALKTRLLVIGISATAAVFGWFILRRDIDTGPTADN